MAAAAHALFGRAPEPDEWADLLDFAGTEWLDSAGLTVAEALAAERGYAELARWPTEARLSLWVVDGAHEDSVLLRDLQDDQEWAVAVTPAALAELPRKTVLRARVVPWRGRYAFFGDPGLYGQPGVLARMELLQQWRAGGEPELLAALRERRLAWGRQRNQRRVFLEHFGEELVVFESAADMESRLAGFLDHLLHRDRGCDGLAPTAAERFHAERGYLPQRIDLVPGPTLQTGRPAICFHERQGLLFLPAFGELRAHLSGHENHPDILDLWLTNPELPAEGLARAGLPPVALDPIRASRPASTEPSVFPEFEPREG